MNHVRNIKETLKIPDENRCLTIKLKSCWVFNHKKVTSNVIKFFTCIKQSLSYLQTYEAFIETVLVFSLVILVWTKIKMSRNVSTSSYSSWADSQLFFGTQFWYENSQGISQDMSLSSKNSQQSAQEVSVSVFILSVVLVFKWPDA